MKVILTEPRASATGPQNAGDEVEVSSSEAARMIAAGTAQPVRKSSKSKPEKAVKE